MAMHTRAHTDRLIALIEQHTAELIDVVRGKDWSHSQSLPPDATKTIAVNDLALRLAVGNFKVLLTEVGKLDKAT